MEVSRHETVEGLKDLVIQLFLQENALQPHRVILGLFILGDAIRYTLPARLGWSETLCLPNDARLGNLFDRNVEVNVCVEIVPW